MIRIYEFPFKMDISEMNVYKSIYRKANWQILKNIVS